MIIAMKTLKDLIWRIMRPALEQAWDEGHEAGVKDESEDFYNRVDHYTVNPYRAER